MTAKLDRWHWKTTGHITFASFSFMDHFLVISEFNFELQSGNAQIRSILAIFSLLWPWNFTDDLQKQKGISSMSFQALCIISLPSVNLNLSYSLESFKSHVTLKFYGRPWKTIGHLFYTHSSFVHHFIQYIPRNMHTVFALLCFVVVIHWLIFPYPSGLLHWHCGNLTIAPVPAKQPWWIWINTSCEFIMNDCITTTKQSTTKPCAYFLGYTVAIDGFILELQLQLQMSLSWLRHG